MKQTPKERYLSRKDSRLYIAAARQRIDEASKRCKTFRGLQRSICAIVTEVYTGVKRLDDPIDTHARAILRKRKRGVA